MPQFLNFNSPEFEAHFHALLTAKREDSPDVDAIVADIITDVRGRGDTALIELTQKFDRVTLTPETIQIASRDVDKAISQVAPKDRMAIELAAKRITSYHKRQIPQDLEWTDEVGASLGWRWTPISKAGLYVPGGLASYPSSVLMNAIPAKVAGVKHLTVTVPTPDGVLNPLVLLAAKLSGVDKIYRIGGAQAIAALAYGTETIAPVDKITGPGNAFVAAAKRRVFGKVGIDMIAGPSEILIIADSDNNPDWIALDLLSQAEHDENAQSLLITTDAALAEKVAAAVDAQLKKLERREIAGKSWSNYGAIIIVPNLKVAASLTDRIAPEHLELCVTNPHELSKKITHAGSIFLGKWTPEAIGDYIGGTNHVLPTARSARFSSGLSVMDFVKRTTLTQMTPKALLAIGENAEILATSESLQAHCLSVTARLHKLNE
ncbi:MAG: histidinol dehydrogenase [Tateyamaria sp.]|nr:histidinol dehydrogenase [Tateyamaria sp.]MCH9833880.1 histidinol dehydrogenase [Alphaproteobacteria bacterium]HAB38625.1 histidinol dehydrogenase [Paracoccaceae bacterium]MBT5303367.1 histidinol dehydrogenase [Tateyamaria sp.]MBT6267542.1 histidinol dehydrogenase [Tateyamaria sp.]